MEQSGNSDLLGQEQGVLQLVWHFYFKFSLPSSDCVLTVPIEL